MSFSVGCDDNDLVEAFVNAGFKEKRNIINDDCLQMFSGSSSGQLGLEFGYARVDDPFELSKFDSIPEHDAAECVPIECAIRI